MGVPRTQDQPAGGQVTLRYWAAAKAATGVAEELVDVSGPVTVEVLVAAAIERHSAGSPRAGAVLRTCSILAGDRPVSAADAASVTVEPGSSVEFLPPFAGG